ncbi:MAG: hypothetical protein GY757_06295 [bacterium]|nr:hypothetical protein [bacterium]
MKRIVLTVLLISVLTIGLVVTTGCCEIFKSYYLVVFKHEGVEGYPDGGDHEYDKCKDEVVSYNFSLAEGYRDLVVKLDGNTVSEHGVISMNRDHTLEASATKINGKIQNQ